MAEPCIVVTGGSRGIGAAICAELARRGRAVVSLSRSGQTPAGRGVACDVTDEAAVRAALAAVAAEGPIAGLVNNVGLHLTAGAASLATEQYEQVMRVNATAVLVVAREAYPHLKANGGGMIVNIGSFFDRMGVPDNLAYCASKAAVGAITRCLAVEWARDGIAVLNVAPGYIATDLNRDYLARERVQAWMAQRIPVGQVGRPQDVARLIAGLFGEAIPFLTGETIYLDGGQGINH
jgi:NAD(P)-dependent dehydrogenase (short-subunit alcohol dehydrogenase family)